MPTGGELADLVETGVISKEEAREIMFGSAENDKEKIEALEEQIEFLRDLVKELSKRQTQTVIHDWNYTKPIRYYGNGVYWANTAKTLADSGLKLDTNTVSAKAINGNTSGTIMSVSSQIS